MSSHHRLACFFSRPDDLVPLLFLKAFDLESKQRRVRILLMYNISFVLFFLNMHNMHMGQASDSMMALA